MTVANICGYLWIVFRQLKEIINVVHYYCALFLSQTLLWFLSLCVDSLEYRP